MVGVITPVNLQASDLHTSFVTSILFIPTDIQRRQGMKYLASGKRGKSLCKLSTGDVTSDGLCYARDFEFHCHITSFNAKSCFLEHQLLVGSPLERTNKIPLKQNTLLWCRLFLRNLS